MKIWTSEHVFNHPWETVVQASWRKYPNPMNPAVIGTDVIERNIVNGVLCTHRLVTSECGFPTWATSLIGQHNICYATERSNVCPRSRKMILVTRNLTLGNMVAMDEKLSYQPCPSDPCKTLLKQEAIVTVSGIPLGTYFEALITSKISHNASKGRQAIEWVISRTENNITHLKEVVYNLHR